VVRVRAGPPMVRGPQRPLASRPRSGAWHAPRGRRPRHGRESPSGHGGPGTVVHRATACARGSPRAVYWQAFRPAPWGAARDALRVGGSPSRPRAGRLEATEIRDGASPWRSGRSTVRHCRVHRHYLPAACRARGGAAHLAAWSGSTIVRRSTARVGSVDVSQTSFRRPASVSRGSCSLSSVLLTRPLARRKTVTARLTCWRRCIPFTSRSHGASVQASHPMTPRPSRS
jgi:hypothetical protein